MADELSILTINGNQKTTKESTNFKKKLSEINDTVELSEGIFPINLKLIEQYQQEDPCLLDKYTMDTYPKGSFHGKVI